MADAAEHIEPDVTAEDEGTLDPSDLEDAEEIEDDDADLEDDERAEGRAEPSARPSTSYHAVDRSRIHSHSYE